MKPTSAISENQASLRAQNHALRAPMRARLDALARIDLPDDVTTLEILEHCRSKRLAAALAVEALCADDRVMFQPNDDDRRKVAGAQIALELAEGECDLFLERWLEEAAPDGSIGTGLWSFVFKEYERARYASLDDLLSPTGTFAEYDCRGYYRLAELKKVCERFREQQRKA